MAGTSSGNNLSYAAVFASLIQSMSAPAPMPLAPWLGTKESCRASVYPRGIAASAPLGRPLNERDVEVLTELYDLRFGRF